MAILPLRRFKPGRVLIEGEWQPAVFDMDSTVVGGDIVEMSESDEQAVERADELERSENE